jgi:16S rRNA (cytidine1402-2'-O)-methyltransferase
LIIFIEKSEMDGLNPKRNLYLIPSTLGESGIERVIPEYNLHIIRRLTYFVVEEEKTVRRFLIRCGYKDINSVVFYVLNEHTRNEDIPPIFCESGNADLGMVSEAGMPGVADPGSMLVTEAYKQQMQIVPLSGPSSLLMALMSSGLNGQNFAFNGYLPQKPQERSAKIKFYEKRSAAENQSQIFIEAPYRNNHLVESLLASLRPLTKLCIAMNLTLPDEWIMTKDISEWIKNPPQDINRKPAVFIFQS